MILKHNRGENSTRNRSDWLSYVRGGSELQDKQNTWKAGDQESQECQCFSLENLSFVLFA